MIFSKELRNQLFNSRSYNDYLHRILKEFRNVRGYKKRLADSAGCQPAYLSQVLAGRTNLTPEQAERMTSFWSLEPLEADYFFNLVLLGRAGTPTLKQKLEAKLAELKESWKAETQSFGKEALNEPERAAIYYSHWLYSAIHLLLTIPGMQSSKHLADHLRRSDEDVVILLKELERAGLVEQQGDSWRTTHSQIHAPQKDFFAEIHHKNWRSQAIEVRSAGHESFVRYTSVHSISKTDASKIKSMIDEMIDKSRSVIEPSPEEIGACLLVDYFSI